MQVPQRSYHPEPVSRRGGAGGGCSGVPGSQAETLTPIGIRGFLSRSLDPWAPEGTSRGSILVLPSSCSWVSLSSPPPLPPQQLPGAWREQLPQDPPARGQVCHPLQPGCLEKGWGEDLPGSLSLDSCHDLRWEKP